MRILFCVGYYLDSMYTQLYYLVVTSFSRSGLKFGVTELIIKNNALIDDGMFSCLFSMQRASDEFSVRVVVMRIGRIVWDIWLH